MSLKAPGNFVRYPESLSVKRMYGIPEIEAGILRT